MAKKKVKINFGEIENLHKNEVLQTPEGPFFINKGIVGKTHQAKEMEDYFNNKIAAESCLPQTVAEGTGSLTSDPKFAEALKKWHETPWQFGNPSEAEWIKEMRTYCLENKIYPPHILQFYKEHHEHR